MPTAMDATPSLTLGDLEGVEEEILEKTLVVEGDQVHPEDPGQPHGECDGTGRCLRFHRGWL